MFRTNIGIKTLLFGFVFIVVLVVIVKQTMANNSATGISSQSGAVRIGTCTGTYPSYWQDPAFPEMWLGQTPSNVPPEDWDGPVFKLSDQYPSFYKDDKAKQPWRDSRFDALFDVSTSPEQKKRLAEEYSWLVLQYIQEGNINQDNNIQDWDVCQNTVRPWYHIPFQTYDALSGREFTHGLTREAPVSFSTPMGNVDGTMWAIGFFNATAAYTLGKVWRPDGNAVIPTSSISFEEGAVVGKPLFTTLTPAQLPILDNMPAWQANLSNPQFCKCTLPSGKECSLTEESQQCPRSTSNWGKVRLLQFDFAVKDSRAPTTQWVFGTFVADGKRKADTSNQWNRLSLLGTMWGNDTPPQGKLAHYYPIDPKKNGFKEEVIIWDTVNELNRYTTGNNFSQFPGHLGCNFRLNGPADNSNSSCMSCHGTASVPDANLITPPLLTQFSGMTNQCVTPDPNTPSEGVDRAGTRSVVSNTISFADMDSLYFANTPSAEPFSMTVSTPEGAVNVMGRNVPDYPNSLNHQWVSLDYSLQLSIALNQWMQWQKHKTLHHESRLHIKEIHRDR